MDQPLHLRDLLSAKKQNSLTPEMETLQKKNSAGVTSMYEQFIM